MSDTTPRCSPTCSHRHRRSMKSSGRYGQCRPNLRRCTAYRLRWSRRDETIAVLVTRLCRSRKASFRTSTSSHLSYHYWKKKVWTATHSATTDRSQSSDHLQDCGASVYVAAGRPRETVAKLQPVPIGVPAVQAWPLHGNSSASTPERCLLCGRQLASNSNFAASTRLVCCTRHEYIASPSTPHVWCIRPSAQLDRIVPGRFTVSRKNLYSAHCCLVWICVIASFGIDHAQYADDTQLYVALDDAKTVLNWPDWFTQSIAELHWLPAHYRIQYKLALITFSVLITQEPTRTD